eukprot:1147758-Pelagomonas_calceolata.AAC.1
MGLISQNWQSKPSPRIERRSQCGREPLSMSSTCVKGYMVKGRGMTSCTWYLEGKAIRSLIPYVPTWML